MDLANVLALNTKVRLRRIPSRTLAEKCHDGIGFAIIQGDG
jgi:hypothetical protein